MSNNNKNYKYLNIFINNIINYNNAIKVYFDLVDGGQSRHTISQPYFAFGKHNLPKLKELDLQAGNYYKIKSILIENELGKSEWIWELA